MIYYTKTAADTKQRIRDLAWMNAGIFAIAGVCALPVSAYFFIAGLVSDAPEAVKLGCQLLTLAAVLLAIYLIVRSKVKKVVMANFEEHEIDGKIDFTIERIDEDTLEFTRLSDEQSFQVSKADIKCIKYLKFTNVVILKDKRTIDIPNRVNIDELISFLYS